MWKYIFIVLKKELKDIFRDKKTWLVGIIIPALVIPLLSLVMINSMADANKRQTSNVTIGLANENNRPALEDFINNELIPLKSDDVDLKLVSVDNIETALDEEEIRAALLFDGNYLNDLSQDKTGKVTIIYNSSNQKSQAASDILEELFNKYEKTKGEERIISKGLDPNILNAVEINYNNMANDSQIAGMILAMIFPIFFVLWPLMGSTIAGPDLGAGEKERGTLEPLLTTKPSRKALILGKYLALLLCSFISVIASFAGIGGIVLFIPEAMDFIQQMNVVISPLSIAVILTVSISLSGIFGALVLALSVYARSFKEAQTYVSPLSIIVLLPVYSTLMTEASDLLNWHFAVPIINAIAIFKEAFMNEINGLHLAITLGSSIVNVAIALILCVKMFEKEKVLFRS